MTTAFAPTTDWFPPGIMIDLPGITDRLERNPHLNTQPQYLGKLVESDLRYHKLRQSRITLPAAPDFIAAKPSSYWFHCSRCVMTGVMSSPASSITVILYQVSYISLP